MGYSKRLQFYLLIDSIIIVLSVFLSYVLRFDGVIPFEYLLGMPVAFLLSWTATVTAFFFFKAIS